MTPPGHQTSFLAHDANGLPLTVADPNGTVTTLAYDAADGLVSVVDPKGLTTSYAYNGLGDALQLASPDTGVSTFVPDAAGNLALATDARGETAAHTYDALGRLVEVDDDDQTIEYLYDQGPNGAGRLTGLTDGAGTMAWTHDAHGRVVLHEQTVDTALGDRRRSARRACFIRREARPGAPRQTAPRRRNRSSDARSAP